MTASVIIWFGIGISTGKFSEQVGAEYFPTETACIDRMSGYEDHRCIPVVTTKEGAEIMLRY